MQRTISIPVAEVIAGGTKRDFYAALRKSIKLATQSVNYCLAESFLIDKEMLVAVGKGEKLPKRPQTYTYPIVKDKFPRVAAVAANLSRAAENTYKNFRFDIAHGRKSLPTQRNVPWPILRARTKYWQDDQGNVCARVRLLDGEFDLRLRGGSNYRDQLKTLRGIIPSEETLGNKMDRMRDCSIRIDRKGKAILCFAITFEREAKKCPPNKKVYHVRTHQNHLLTVLRNRASVAFTINRDDFKRWGAEKTRRMERLRQDRKIGQSKKYVTEKMGEISGKYNRRVKSLIHEITAQIVGHCVRRKVTEIAYDATIKSYFSSFPWFDLKEKLRYKCESAGIILCDYTVDVTQPSFDKPYIYFDLLVNPKTKLSSGVIKIGKTTRKEQRHKEHSTVSDVIVLAAINYEKDVLGDAENHWLGYFQECRIDAKRELFEAEPVMEYLREVGLFGKCGNLSQILQVVGEPNIEAT